MQPFPSRRSFNKDRLHRKCLSTSCHLCFCFKEPRRKQACRRRVSYICSCRVQLLQPQAGFYETNFASSVISVLPAKSREMGQPLFASCAALSKVA
jgi:hypothetical protein